MTAIQTASTIQIIREGTRKATAYTVPETEIKLRKLPEAFEGLTILQQRFVEIIFKNPLIPHSQALAKAGSTQRGASADVYASQLLSMPKIKGYLDHLRGNTALKTQKTVDDAVAELAKVGFANIQDYIKENNDILDLSKIPRDVAAAIASIETTAATKRAGRKVKFTNHNKVTALKEFLDRLQGKPKQQVEVKAVILKRELTDAEVKELMKDKAIVDDAVADAAIAT